MLLPLEPRPAPTLATIAAVEIVLRISHSHVHLTQLLGLDNGSRPFALQKGVAARVSCGEQTVPRLEFLSLPQVL